MGTNGKKKKVKGQDNYLFDQEFEIHYRGKHSVCKEMRNLKKGSCQGLKEDPGPTLNDGPQGWRGPRGRGGLHHGVEGNAAPAL